MLVGHCAAIGEDEAVGWGPLAEIAGHFCDSLGVLVIGRWGGRGGLDVRA